MCATTSISQFLMLVTVLMSCATCCAQESALTIAGDVPSPGTYPFSADESVTLQRLLQKSGVTTQRGRACVVRGPATPILSTNTNQANPTPLVDGDIVVFRLFDERFTGRPHVVIVDGHSPRVVPVDGGIRPLGHVLSMAGLRLSQPASVVRPAWSTLDIFELRENDNIQHGDVIRVDRAAPMSGLRITETFSESAIPVMQASVTSPDVSQYETAPIPLAPPSAGLHVPPPGNSAILYVPEDNANLSGATVFTSPQEPSSYSEFVSNEPMELRLPEDQDSTGTTSTASTPFRTASLENRLAATETIPLSDSYKSAGNSSSNAMWNSVFVVGLIFAMGLIVAGWLKTRSERDMELQMAENLKVKAPAENVQVSESLSVNNTEALAMTPAPVEVADDLAACIGEETPILSAGIDIDQAATDEVVEGEEVWIKNQIDDPEIVGDTERVDAKARVSQEWFADDWRETEQQAAIVPSQKDQVPAAGPDLSSASDHLEDLIQNRLPVELGQTELPLRVALFGKPAGPQRIRIDAAHTKLAAPHMASISRKKQRQTPVAETPVASGSDKPAAPVKRSSRASVATNDDSSRFDRALNYLEEQSEK